MSMDIVFNWGDPIIGVHRTYLSSNIRPHVWTNTQAYTNPKVDELLRDGRRRSSTPRSARRCTRTFEQIVTDELPIYYINVVPYHTACDKKVMNVPESHLGTDVADGRGLAGLRRRDATAR